MPKDCPPCEPTNEPPQTTCPDGTLQTWYWDYQLCKWIPKDCPPCDPSTVTKPDCPPGVVCCYQWDQQNCKWLRVECPTDLPRCIIDNNGLLNCPCIDQNNVIWWCN